MTRRRLGVLLVASALVLAGVGILIWQTILSPQKAELSRLRLELARALAITPEVFLADDPPHSIDLRSPETGAIIRRLGSLSSDDSTGNGMTWPPTVIPRISR